MIGAVRLASPTCGPRDISRDDAPTALYSCDLHAYVGAGPIAGPRPDGCRQKEFGADASISPVRVVVAKQNCWPESVRLDPQALERIQTCCLYTAAVVITVFRYKAPRLCRE